MPNIERQIYLWALEDIAAKVDAEMALDLHKAWSVNAKNKNLAHAACEYVSNFVLPALAGNKSNAPIPRWIYETLLAPPTKPKDIPEFLRLFGSNYTEALNERTRGAGMVIDPATTYWPEMVTYLREKNYGLYFTPNPIDGEKVSEKGSRRLDENVRRLSACFADFDGGDKASQALVMGMYLEPSIVVESKNGYHAYWMLEDSDMAMSDWRAIQDAIIKKCGSDKAVRNPSRLMRLPFSWHCKTDDKFQVRIAAFNWRRYRKEELFAAFDVQIAPKTAPRVYSDAPRALRVPSMDTLGSGVRHPTLEHTAASTYARLPQDQAQAARDMLKAWYSGVCKPLKNTWEKEVDDMCDWCERREFGSVVSN